MTTPAGSAASARTYAVIFDGACNVCRRLVRRLEEWDSAHSLEMVPAQSPGVLGRFPWIEEAAFAESMQVVRISDGRTWQGAAAIEQLMEVLPRGRWIGWTFSVPFVRPLADRFYRWFAKSRYRMGCGDHCSADRPAANSVRKR